MALLVPFYTDYVKALTEGGLWSISQEIRRLTDISNNDGGYAHLKGALDGLKSLDKPNG